MKAIDIEHGCAIGPYRTAAVVCRRVVTWQSRGVLRTWVSKTPLAILIASEEAMHAFDTHGNAISADEIEYILPGALARMGEHSG